MSENRKILKEEKQWLIVILFVLACALFFAFTYTVIYLAFEKADEIKAVPPPSNTAQKGK